MRTRDFVASTCALLAVFAIPSAASAYAPDADATTAIANFRTAYASQEESAREKAVKDLGATKHKHVVDALATALKDKSSMVRRAAAVELGAQWSPNAVSALSKALRTDDASAKDTNLAIVKALGATGSDEAIPTLVSLLAKKPANPKANPDDVSSSYTLVALKALTAIASPKAMDDVLLFLISMGRRGGRGADDEFGKAAEDTLAAITGASVKGTNEWNRWWNENKAVKKVFQVYRCEGTGMTFEHADAKTKCPHDGDKVPHCGFFLREKLEGGGQAKAKDDKRDNNKKDKKKDKSKDTSKDGSSGSKDD